MSPTNRNESEFMDRLEAGKIYVTHCKAREKHNQTETYEKEEKYGSL